MKNIKNIVLILTFQLVVFPFYSLGAGVPLRINFQGKLEESGEPATGVKSFVFKIYDALTDGNLIWTSQTESVTVINGIFSVILQTGTSVNLSTATFSGARYIQISVNGTPLSPREEIVPSPYSMVAQSLSADAKVDWNALINVPAGLDDGDDTGATGAILSQDTLQSGTTFYVSSGTVQNLYANAFSVGGSTFVVKEGKVGIGTTSPGLKLDVVTYTPAAPGVGVASFFAPALTSGQNADIYIGRANSIGECGIFGHKYNTPTNDSFIYILNYGDSLGTGLSVRKGGNVGIGTTNPTAKLHVAGSGGTALKVEDTTSYSALLAKGVNEAEIEMEATGSASGQRVYRWRSGDNVLKAQLFNDAHTVTLVDNILVLNSNGNVGIGTAGPTAKLDINGDVFRVEISSTITTANSPGNTGDIRWDANYIYICVSPDTWKRAALSTW